MLNPGVNVVPSKSNAMLHRMPCCIVCHATSNTMLYRIPCYIEEHPCMAFSMKSDTNFGPFDSISLHPSHDHITNNTVTQHVSSLFPHPHMYAHLFTNPNPYLATTQSQLSVKSDDDFTPTHSPPHPRPPTPSAAHVFLKCRPGGPHAPFPHSPLRAAALLCVAFQLRI